MEDLEKIKHALIEFIEQREEWTERLTKCGISRSASSLSDVEYSLEDIADAIFHIYKELQNENEILIKLLKDLKGSKK